MKKLILLTLFIVSSFIFGHAALVSVDDNEDGTIYIEGAFSNGDSTKGLEIIIVKDRAYNGPEETFEGKLILFRGELDEKGSLTIIKPATSKYEVIFYAGSGHVASKKGIKLSDEEKEQWNEAVMNATNLGEWKEKMLQK